MSDNTIYNEKELLRGIAEADEKSFFAFYDHYSTLLRPFLWKYTRSTVDIEEIIQETFIKVWINRDRLEEVERVRSWIYKIASRVYLDYMTRLTNEKRRIHKLAASGSPTETFTPFEGTHVREINASIMQAVSNLSEQKKKVFTMSREQGMKPAQIALKLDMPVGTVKNQLSAALKEIREHLIASGHGPIAILYLLIKIF